MLIHTVKCDNPACGKEEITKTHDLSDKKGWIMLDCIVSYYPVTKSGPSQYKETMRIGLNLCDSCHNPITRTEERIPLEQQAMDLMKELIIETVQREFDLEL